MFQFRYFNIPRILSRNYCLRALQTLEKVVKQPQQGIVNLIVIDTEEMAAMNEKFRGKTGPTDILTFSYYNSDKREKRKKKNEGFSLNQNLVAWEIYLCPQKIKLYAKESGKTYQEQLEYIIIHGLTHLMGYDHENDNDWHEMEKVEKKIQSLFK